MNGHTDDSDPARVAVDTIWKVLESIIDPCSRAVGAPSGLVSMGLVLEVSVEGAPGAAIVNVRLGITEPGCMMQGIFSATADREIRALPGVAEVDVHIDHEYVWSPVDMAAEYRDRLSEVRTERQLRAEDRLVHDIESRGS